MNRTFCVGGNWKMNGSRTTISEICKRLCESGLANRNDIEVIVASPAPYLAYCRDQLPSAIHVAAQNASHKLSGAFTGELSPTMIKDVGCDWVLLGHSERRTIFNESDALVGEKVKLALETGLNVIVCVGETLEERENARTEQVVFRQMDAIVPAVGTHWSRVVIAYEPVWAIGTGRTAEPHEAQQVHNKLRSWLSEKVGVRVAQTLRIQYGGSVTAANCRELAAQPDIDGFLVGGASLKPEFIDICNARQ